MNLPEVFIKNVSSYFDEGKSWLKDLPQLISHFENAWSFKTLDHYLNLSFNFVAPVKLNSGQEAVFKLGVPRDELQSEITALKHWQGKGSVLLLQSDLGKGALLLEKLEPGLSFWHSTQDDLAAQTCAELLVQLWQAKPPFSSKFVNLERWTQALTDYHANHSKETSLLPWDLLDKAFQLRNELLKTEDVVLLHGDLHHDNILSASRQPYLAIDPKGLIGPRGYDVGPFLMNPYGVSKKPAFKKQLEHRLDIFSAHLNLPRQELAAWGFVHCVLSVCWSIDSNSFPKEPLDIARALSES
jgi:streptomycin 6-kinase